MTMIPRYVGHRSLLRARIGVPADAAGRIALAGLPLDGGQTYRTGARFAPAAIREASSLFRPYDSSMNIEILADDVVDVGDAPVPPTGVAAGFAAIEEFLADVLAAQPRALMLAGGDCSIAVPVLRALHAVHGQLAVIHCDAHTDTWDTYWDTKFTHGTPFRRAVEEGLVDPRRSTQIGMRGPGFSPNDLQASRDLGYTVVPAGEFHDQGPVQVGRMALDRTEGMPTLIHFDIDCLDPAYAPGTGIPEVGGLTTAQAMELLASLRGLNIVAGQVTEVLPHYDPIGGITAVAAANILSRMTALALVRR